MAGRKWWLRTVAVVIGGGSVATGAWVGFGRSVAADTKPVLTQPSAPARATMPEPFDRPRDISVLPATAAVPPEPTVPVIPPPALDMGLQPPAALPLPPAPSLPPPPTLPAPPAPALPAPDVKPIVPVAAPFPPSEVPPLPTPKPAVPPLPAAPVVPATPVISPPDLIPSPAPLPSVPSVGVPVAPPAGIALPAPPVKVNEPAKPNLPTKPDSDLPTGNGGINVKTDKVGGNSGPAVPSVPAIPMLPSAPTSEPVNPVKPVEPPLTTPKLPAVPAVGKPSETPSKPVSQPKPVEPPLRDPDKNVAPLPSNPLVPTPGDNTMIPLSRSVAAAVIGGMMLAPAPTPAASPVPVFPVPSTPVVPIQADDKTEVAELKKQLEDSNRKLNTIQDQLKLLTELLNGRKDEKGFPLPSDTGLVAQMRELKDRLAQIEKDLAAYKSSTALRPANPIVETKPAKGTVRVVNEYPVQISIVVNGTSYRVAPSKTLDVEVTAGEFSYQLLESGAALTKSAIKDKETVTLRIK